MKLQDFKISESDKYSQTLDLVNDNGDLILSGIDKNAIQARLESALKETNNLLTVARSEMTIWVLAKTSKTMLIKSTDEYQRLLNLSLTYQTAIDWVNDGTMTIIAH